MNIINVEHINKIFGDKLIFEDASVGIQEGDKIGIVGINGTGKTTLLRMIAGEEVPDSGNIVRQNSTKIAFLTQNPWFPADASVAEYAEEGNEETGWKVLSNLNELGITDFAQKIDSLSGGQRRRVALAKILAEEFDVLLLDEPTNHLDEEMIRWLEEYLVNFKGVLVMVTHDRYFLDKVCNRILEISRGNIYSYQANYSQFLELKAEREEMELASERKRQSILRMEIEWAKRGCRARSTKQRARLERLEQLKNRKAPTIDETVELESVKTRMGKKTIELHHIFKSYGDRTIIKDFDYVVLKNQRLGFVGSNGCGKSTLMKIVAGLEKPDEGSVIVGDTIKIGYFAQEEHHMNEKERVIDYVKDIAEYINTKDGKISASMMLERFLFSPEMQYAPIGKLSGGEKRRLYLLGVLCQEINVLILDEPGNNLDIPTLTILEDFLNNFPGIVITVSHDRYFLDNVVDRIFEFQPDGTLKQYEGGYTDYLETKQRNGTGANDTAIKENSREKKEKENAKNTWKQNRQTKLKFSFQEQREYDNIDDEIAKLETQIEKLDQEMLKNATNSVRLSELIAEKEQTEKQLEEKMDRWVYLNDLAERIAEQ